jgi:hypothetical protein
MAVNGGQKGEFSAEKAPFQRTVGHLVGDSVQMVEDNLLQVHLDLLHLPEDDAALPLNLLLPEGGVDEDVGEDLHRPLHVLRQALRVEHRLLPAPYSQSSRVLKDIRCSLATKFTYKKRLGGMRDVGSGTRPAQTNIKKKS